MPDESNSPGAGPQSPARTLELDSAAHGHLVFDLALTVRRQIMVDRGGDPEKRSAADLATSIARACVTQAGDLEFLGDAGVRDRENLAFHLTPEELATFAHAYLAYNDHLTSRVESHDEGKIGGVTTHRLTYVPRSDVAWQDDPTERLHQAWTIHHHESLESLERLNAPFKALRSLEIASSWDRVLNAGLGSQRGPLHDLPGGLGGLLRERDITDGLSRAVRDMERRTLGLTHLSSSVGGRLGMNRLSEIAGPRTMDGAIARLLREDRRRWEQLRSLDGLTPRFESARAIAEGAFSSLFAKLQTRTLLDGNMFDSVVGRSSRAVTGYLEKTARIAKLAQPRDLAAIDVAMQLASAHIQATGEVTGRLIDQSSAPVLEHGEQIRAGEDALDLLDRQRDEILALSSDENLTGEEAAAAAPLLKLATLIREVLTLVSECNETAKLHGRENIFSTDHARLWRAAAQLPLQLPRDLESFGTAVDHLYFLIYEGAGSDNLRFENGKAGSGVFDRTEEEFQTVMDLKFLRTKWLRHDPERGGSGASKTFESIKATLLRLGATSFPRSPSDFERLYFKLVSRLHAFLSELRSRLDAQLPSRPVTK